MKDNKIKTLPGHNHRDEITPGIGSKKFQSVTRIFLTSNKSRDIICPHCGNKLSFEVEIEWMGPDAFLCGTCDNLLHMFLIHRALRDLGVEQKFPLHTFSENQSKHIINEMRESNRMPKTLYDIIDSWTMNWDRSSIEITLEQVSAPFYKRKLVFFLLEEIWNALEFIDDPLEFMTEERKIKEIENILSSARNERAAKFVRVEIVESPKLKIAVLNAEKTITKNPGWFKPWEGVTWKEVAETKLENDEQNLLDLQKKE